MSIKKVMFHINSLEKGGAERVVTVLAGQMAAAGIDVSIATEWTGKKEYSLPEGVRRLDAGLSSKQESLKRLGKIRARKDNLKKLLLKEKPDVLFAFCRNANYRAVMAADKTGIPVIVSVRNDPKVYYASVYQKLLSEKLYSKAAGIVFQTEEAADFFPEKIRKKSRVIMNPVSPKYLKVTEPEKRRPVIANAARFAYAKDHMTLVKGFELVLKKHPEYTLELYGDRSEDNEIHQVKEWVKGHKLDEKILFMGNVQDLEKRLSDISVFVLSSVYEGMPNALMEAMAMGIPSVSSDCPCGGPASLIDDGYSGLLFTPGDERELCTAVTKLIENPGKAEELGRHGAEKMRECTPEKIAAIWLEYAEKVIR
ncbi:MAG: glycosyltransferase [Lachnospiraceae bacterium]|nr:glycosyltransferase [Lachnospiraceae bacterium]